MSGRAIRLQQLINPESGRSFIVAFDHGQSLPIDKGLGNPVELLGKIIDGGVEGILLNRGMLEQASDLFARPGAPAPILRADWTPLDKAMKEELGEAHRIITTPEEALRLGASAVCVYLIGRPKADQMFFDNVEGVADYISRAHAIGLPVIVEATLWGLRNEDLKDAERLRTMCRIAAELGADAIKTEYVGDVEAERTIIEEVGNIPVFTLGGAAASRESVKQAAQDAISAGATGLIFGRNVWQAEDMPAVINDLNEILHGAQA